MTRRIRGPLLTAIAVVLVACAPPPRAVAPLRAAAATKAADAPFRQSPPPLPPIAEAADPPPRDVTLASGLRVVLVERRDYPVVAARLVIARSSLDLDDAGAKRVHQMTYLYGRGGDEAAFERASAETARSGTTVGGDASSDAITWSVDAPTADLDKAWELLAQRTFGARLTRAEYDRRAAEWTDALKSRGMSLLNAEADVLFGRGHPYGYAGERTMMTFEDAQSLHARLLQPSQATADRRRRRDAGGARGGDDSLVRGIGRRPARRSRGEPRLAPAIHGPSLAVVRTRVLAEQRPTALFAARAAAARRGRRCVLGRVLQSSGGIGAALFEEGTERDGRGVQRLGELLPGARGLVAVAHRGVRPGEGRRGGQGVARRDPAPARRRGLRRRGRARQGVRSSPRWRVRLATVEGAAQLYESAVILGTDLDRVAKLPERLAKVGRADVVRVASRYLAPEGLHVAFVSEERGYTTESLGMGDEKVLEPAKE